MTVWRFLFLSIALHFALWTFLIKNAEDSLAKKEKPIEITIVERPNSADNINNYFRGIKLPQKPIDPKLKKNIKRYGENDQLVSKETQSKNLGVLQNKSGEKDRGKKDQKHEKADRSKNKLQTPDGLSIKKLTDISQTLFSEQSKSDRRNEEIEEGLVTSLSTQRSLYFSFFSRVDEKYFPLVQRAYDEIISRLSASDFNKVALTKPTADIEIILDRDGKYLETIVISSEMEVLNKVPRIAAEQAYNFPNPPHDLIKPDGKIHLPFRFRFFITDNAMAARRTPRL